jgi:hypothetical protein
MIRRPNKGTAVLAIIGALLINVAGASVCSAPARADTAGHCGAKWLEVYVRNRALTAEEVAYHVIDRCREAIRGDSERLLRRGNVLADHAEVMQLQFSIERGMLAHLIEWAERDRLKAR